ncbi:hypothetical protein [Gymnodinialimonas ulvae]|uniref:hypothetical protein n=1 Tax=Gymnodinialimonas ulvae TaxID=3126504 RepID=UPI0030A33168
MSGLLTEVWDKARAGRIEKDEYARLSEALEAVRDRNDIAWMQAWIVLHCATRNKAFATQRLIARLSRVSRKAGQEAEYYAFLRLVEDDLGFYLPNGSAFTESFRGADVDAVMADCRVLAARMAELGLEVFANSGTLLGLVREGKLLDYDNDIDLGVLLAARNEADAAQEWIALCDRLITEGVGVERSTWSGVTLKLNKIGPFGVDLFPAWIDETERVFVYPHTFGTLTSAQVLPFSHHAGTGLGMPSDAEAMLASNYGDSWRVPNEGWTFGWKEANARFAGFLDAVKV